MWVLANDFAAGSSLWDLDLSRNKSLRTLKLRALSVNLDDPPDTTSSFLKHILSTITSSAFSEIIAIYEDHHFRGVESWKSSKWPHLREMSRAERKKEALFYRSHFKLFREAQKVRSFGLVLCASTSGYVGEYPVQVLEEAVAEEGAKRGFGDFLFEPSVMYDPQRTCLG